MKNRYMRLAVGVAGLIASVAAVVPAQAVVVVSGNGTLSSTDPTQLGRVSRSGIGTGSTWGSSKAYPGTLNATTSYAYDLINGTYSANSVQAIYYEITYNSVNAAVAQPFAVAYLNSFVPTNVATNYLGDAGGSVGGTGAGTPISFQVVVGTGNSLRVNFSEVFTGNLPTDYTYSISAYSDANRGENFLPGAAVPEPATWAMMILGFALAGCGLRRAHTRSEARFNAKIKRITEGAPA